MLDIDTTILTEEEQAIFEVLLGKMELPRRSAPVKTKFCVKPNTRLHPYILEIKYVCNTCGSCFSTMFNMVPAIDGSGLVSSTMEKCSVPANKTTRRTCNSCANCRDYLRTKDKEEIISLYLNTMTVL